MVMIVVKVKDRAGERAEERGQCSLSRLCALDVTIVHRTCHVNGCLRAVSSS
jgi:hypothetical protein